MPLSNRQKLEIIARAKKNGYRGDYLELFRMAEQQMRQDKPEVEFRGGGFSNDINKPGKSTYVDARSGYGFPTTYEHGGPHTDVTDFVTDFEAQNPGRYLPPSSLDSVQAITNLENFLERIKKYDTTASSSATRGQDFKDNYGIRGELRRVPYYEAGEGIMNRTYNTERSTIEVAPDWYVAIPGGQRKYAHFSLMDDNPTTAFTKSDIKGVKKPRPELQIMPTIPAGPIPTNIGEFEMQKIPMPTFPDTGPSKADLFFQGLENAQVYYNRPDEFTKGRREGDPTVSTQYIFSPNNPFVPKDGQYFMSEANTRGQRKTYGDLDKARQWEREQGLGTQTDLRGYNVGNTFKHGGFAAFFASDYDKYVKKEEGGTKGPKQPTGIDDKAVISKRTFDAFKNLDVVKDSYRFIPQVSPDKLDNYIEYDNKLVKKSDIELIKENTAESLKDFEQDPYFYIMEPLIQEREEEQLKELKDYRQYDRDDYVGRDILQAYEYYKDKGNTDYTNKYGIEDSNVQAFKAMDKVLPRLNKLTDAEVQEFTQLINTLSSAYTEAMSKDENFGAIDALNILRKQDISGIQKYREKMGLSKDDILNLIQAPKGSGKIVKGLTSLTRSALKLKPFQDGGYKYSNGGTLQFFASSPLEKLKTASQYAAETVSDPVRKKIADNLYPVSYKGGVSRIINAVRGKKDPRDERTGTKEDPKHMQERTDLLRLHMGQDQKYNSVPKSEYKPSKAKDDDVTYYTSPSTEEIIRNNMEYLSDQKSFYTDEDSKKMCTDMGGVLGRYTLSKGEDEKGKYISYYDKYDFNPFDYNKLPEGLSKAYEKTLGFFGMDAPEVYGRVYYDEKTGKAKKQKGGLGDPPTKLQGLLPFLPQSPISTTNMTGQQLRNAMMQYLHNTGRDTVNVNTAIRAIGEMESKNDPMAVQVSGNKKTGFYAGPGKGKFQYEDTPKGGANTAVNRLVDLTKSKLGVTPTELPADFRPGVHKLPVYPELANIYKTTTPNVTELDEKYQDALFIADNILGKNSDGTLRASIFNEAVNKTNMSQEDVFKLWLKNHKKKITVSRKGKDVTIDVNKATKKEIDAEMKKFMDRTSTSFE